MQIKDNVFLVTGGASGLGAATARMIIDAGGKVLVADVRDAEGRAFADELGERARFLRTDVTDESSVGAAVVAAVDFGALRGLVSCAGIVHAERIVKRDGAHALAGFSRTIGVNLIGAFNAMRLACEVMARSQPTASGER